MYNSVYKRLIWIWISAIIGLWYDEYWLNKSYKVYGFC